MIITFCVKTFDSAVRCSSEQPRQVFGRSKALKYLIVKITIGPRFGG